jgi:hypothetical protein
MARFDGMSVLVVAGGVALYSAYARDVTGAVIGLLVAAAGAIELHGVALLRSGRDGMRWLVSSQLYLMGVMLCYVAFRLTRPDISWLQELYVGPAAEPLQQLAQQNDVTVDQLLREMVQTVYYSVAAVTVLYQGGMTLYYLKRRNAVGVALQNPESQ